MYKNAKGFTFVELIVATVILAIVVAGVYAAFLSAAKFSGTFMHKVMAVIGAQGWLEKTLAEKKFDSSDLPDTDGFVDIPDPDSGTPENEDLYLWGGTYTGLSSEVGNLDEDHLPQFEISEESLAPDVDDDGNPDHSYTFKRITITVTWDERKI